MNIIKVKERITTSQHKLPDLGVSEEEKEAATMIEREDDEAKDK